jgi:hypothetical protein
MGRTGVQNGQPQRGDVWNVQPEAVGELSQSRGHLRGAFISPLVGWLGAQMIAGLIDHQPDTAKAAPGGRSDGERAEMQAGTGPDFETCLHASSMPEVVPQRNFDGCWSCAAGRKTKIHRRGAEDAEKRKAVTTNVTNEHE